MKDVTDKTQYDLIREDIDLIEKYYGTTQYNGLINDILIHVKSAELQRDIANKKLDKIKELVNKYGYYTLSEIPELLSIIDGE